MIEGYCFVPNVISKLNYDLGNAYGNICPRSNSYYWFHRGFYKSKSLNDIGARSFLQFKE